MCGGEVSEMMKRPGLSEPQKAEKAATASCVVVGGVHRVEACKALGETKIVAMLVQARRK